MNSKHIDTAAGPMVTENCPQCHLSFAIPAPLFYDAQRKCKKLTLYCPKGHPWSYLGETEEDRLRHERDRLKQNKAYLEDKLNAATHRLEHEERRTAAYKGQLTKLKKRAKAGVCPCCSRQFKDLKRHMERQHPNFQPETGAEEQALRVVDGGKSK